MPYLRKLRDLTRETANLAVSTRNHHRADARGKPRDHSLTKVGGRVAMVASGVGKAVLATWSDDDVNAIIRRQGMPRSTEKSIVRPSDLFKELEAIRGQGYAVDDEEARLGLRCVAAVIYNDCSEPLAAISGSGMNKQGNRRAGAGVGKSSARGGGGTDRRDWRRDAGGESFFLSGAGAAIASQPYVTTRRANHF